MADLDLRPLSLGEILDRTFSLYRRNFLLFVGITAIPQLLVLGLNLAQVLTKGTATRKPTPGNFMNLGATGILLLLIGILFYFVAHLYAQGGTVHAVSELYLGRSTSIGDSLRRMRGHALNLFGVLFLNGLAILAGIILLIIPGIYVACRLITCIPAALLENLGAGESLERSFALTKDNAGRSFVIYLLYCALLYGAILLLALPFSVIAVLSGKDPAMMRMWLALSQVGSFFATVLVAPIFTIATAVLYYDLRVRKEAFDLQLMMNPDGNASEIPGPTKGGVPSMFS